jgi:hypothetical protein
LSSCPDLSVFFASLSWRTAPSNQAPGSSLRLQNTLGCNIETFENGCVGHISGNLPEDAETFNSLPVIRVWVCGVRAAFSPAFPSLILPKSDDYDSSASIST